MLFGSGIAAPTRSNLIVILSDEMGYSHLGCYGGEIQTPNFDALVHEPGQLPDIMATCLEAAGASYPREFGGRAITPLEGRSLLPAFAGRSIERDGLFWEHEGNRTVRVGQWKLVAKGPGGPWELHDLAADRTEMNDLGGQQPERVKQPAAQWDAWAKRAHVLSWPWQTKTRNPNVESRNKSE